MISRWQEIKKENPWLKTEYYDFDKDEGMVEKYKITKPPTFIFLNKEGEEFLRLHGKICNKELSDIISMTKNR
jgi:thioredoxin-related protein